MPFFRPSVKQIRERRISDFEYEMGSQAARFPGTVENGLAVSGSGAAHGLHGHLADVAKNAFPHLADDERLIQWASFFGVYQIEANRSSGLAICTSSDNAPHLLPLGTIYVREDGVQYKVVADTIVDGGGFTPVEMIAVIAGANGDILSGGELTLQTPVAGISTAAVVGSGGIVGGLDAETSSALRTRLLARLASPPKGGGPNDYVSWAKLVPGVTRAWEFRWAPKVGNVTVLFMRDLDLDPFPDAGEIQEVQDSLNLFAPVIAPEPFVQAPDKVPLVLVIDNLQIEDGYLLADVRANIYQSIRDMLLTKFEPLATSAVLYKSWIQEAISSAVGEYSHELTSPVGDYAVGSFSLPVLEDAGITWA